MATHQFRFRVGFVGAGNMAEAICKSLVTILFYKPDDIAAFDVSEERTSLFRNQYGTFICRDNLSLVEQSENIILAVKPQQVPEVIEQIKPGLGQDQLLVSIAAGISTNYLETGLGRSIPVVRAMPNTPMMIGQGATALCRGKFASEKHLEFARSIFASAGIALTLDESLIDAVTAVSGSGPAYLFYLVEAMVQAGTELGLKRDDALNLAAQTALGAMRMVLETKIDPAELRQKVTSRGGTTAAAIGVLDDRNVKQNIVDAIHAAAKRSKELGK